MAAGTMLKQALKMLGHARTPRTPPTKSVPGAKYLLAAALHGAIFAFAAVKACVDRASATATRRLTVTRPG